MSGTSGTTFDELFDESRESEAFELEELSFEVAQRLNERLDELSAAGMSQAKLADVLNVSPAYVSRVLHGRPENMTLGTIVKFARALGCRVTAPKIIDRAVTGTMVLGTVRSAPAKLWESWSDIEDTDLTHMATIAPHDIEDGSEEPVA